MMAQIARSLDMLPIFQWFTPERRVWILAVTMSGLLGFAMGNGHTTQNAIQNVSDAYGVKSAEVAHLQTKVVPALKKENILLKRAIISKADDASTGDGKPH